MIFVNLTLWRQLGNYTYFRAIALTIFICLFSSSQFHGQDFKIDKIAQADETVTYFVSSDNTIKMTIIPSNIITDLINVRFQLTDFTNTDAGSIKVMLKPAKSPNTAYRTDTTLSLSKDPFTIELMTDSTMKKLSYKGRLNIFPEVGKPKSWEVTLVKTGLYKPAELEIVGDNNFALVVTKSLFSSSDYDGFFDISVKEKSGDWPLEGLTLNIKEVPSSPEEGFGLKNIRVTINNTGIENFHTWPPPLDSNFTEQSSLRRVADNGITNLRIGLKDLEAGFYKVKLCINAANSTADPQIINLTVTVRSNMFFAIIILFFSVAISFLVTVLAGNMKKKSRLQKRINDLEYCWLRNEPAYLPVIWVRSVLRQCRDFANRYSNIAADEVEEKIKQATEMMKLLKTASQMQTKIDNLQESDLVKNRLKAKLVRIISELGSTPPTEEVITNFNTKITELQSIFDKDKFETGYWDMLLPSINQLLLCISLPDLDKSKKKEMEKLLSKMDKLLSEMEKLKEKQQEGKNIKTIAKEKIAEIEKTYVQLKILWQHRDTKYFTKLAEIIKADKSLNLLFQEDNSAIWELMKKEELRIKLPKESGPDPFEAFQLLLFKIETDSKEIKESFLFKRGLTYEWYFELSKPSLKGIKKMVYLIFKYLKKIVYSIFKCLKRKREDSGINNLKPETVGPNISQYAPRECEIIPSVQFRFNHEVIKLANGDQTLETYSQTMVEPTEKIISRTKQHKIKIVAPRAFRFFKRIERGDYILTVVGFIFATIAGITTIYYQDNGFGSLKDYLLLILMAAGIDKSKDGIKIVRDYTSKNKEE